MSLESLSKEEIIQKYKGVLSIAKKAKQAKDELSDENRILKEQLLQYETQKEADKKSLMTMKEMLEVYTENKLQLTTEVAELQKLRKSDCESLEKFSIENESMKRQLQRLTEENESLLTDIENMEGQLEQVSRVGKEQKQQIILLVKEIAELKEPEIKKHEIEVESNELRRELDELKERYKFIKNVNTEQRLKFNSLKDRFIEVHKKLKKLKECKRILLETQHEYADAVSQWQNEIIKASKFLCKELNDLREENKKLLLKLTKEHVCGCTRMSTSKLDELLHLSVKAKYDYQSLQEENVNLKKHLVVRNTNCSPFSFESTVKKLDELWLLSKTAFEEYNDIRKENVMLKDHGKSKCEFDFPTQEFGKCYIKASKLEELQVLVTKAADDYKNQSFEMEELKKSIEKLKNECSAIEHYQNECEILKEKNIFLEEDNDLLKKQIRNLENIPKSPVEEYVEDDQKISEVLTPMESENLIQKLEKVTGENLALKDKVRALERSANFKEHLLVNQQILDENQLKYKQKELEHCELLDEMRELNEALKARGDLISRQQEEHQILKTELKITSAKLSKIQEEMDKKDVQLNEKQSKLDSITTEVVMSKKKLEILENANSLNEEKIRVLSIELDNIRPNPAASSTDYDNQSDILSTSTISRADELQRLKDVEDSFEDKYNKLRSLAAKLKKKLQEETALKQKVEKEVQDLNRQESELNTQILEFKHKISDMDSLREELNEKQKHIDSLKTENQKLKSTRKQTNVLNLEIEAAEKSLADVTNKLINRSLELETAQASLKSKDSTITQLRKEINLLEASKSAETKHSQELKQQIDHLHKTLKDEMYSKQQAYEKSKLLEQDVENLKLELENIKVELAESTSNQESALKSLNHERGQLSLQLSTVQAALFDCEQKLKQAERTCDDLRVEYLDYKVKAQAVLRQNQNRDSSKERELEEDLLAMRTTETRLNSTIQTLTLKIESLEKQRCVLSDDNASLQKRSKELMTLVEDLRTQNDALNQDIQQHIQRQHETLKQHRQQIDSIDNCHKEQLQSLNASHQKELEHLRNDLSQHIRLPITVGATKASSLAHHTHIDHSADQGKLDFLLMEREDAEGSEEAAEALANLAASRKISNDSSSAKRSVQDFMPLDELLNTPLNAINSETLITNSQLQQQYITDPTLNAANSTDFLQLELNSTKERLQKQESRVRHLTTLLAENEQDLAKLTQMNDMLKEELRRQERSVEREQHMHNSEYVKNVIMKFLTLNNADEKIRLVPVLNTILKLSRSEAEMLNCVAKGLKVSENTQRSGGWGNFLPWSSNNNNNN